MMSKFKVSMIVCMSLLAYVVVFPVAEWSIGCPTADDNIAVNETCTNTKVVMWELVAMLSLYSGDGMPLTPSVDEADYRNVVPILFAMLVIILVKANSKISELENRIKKPVRKEHK